MLLTKKKVAPDTIWEAATKQIDAWGVFCHILLGDAAVHPMTYKVASLFEENNFVDARRRSQAQQQPTLPVALLYLIKMYFNGRFHQALEWHHRVRWAYFERLWRYLATGIFGRTTLRCLGISRPISQASPHDSVGHVGNHVVATTTEPPHTPGRPEKEAAQNPGPDAHLQVPPGIMDLLRH